MIVKTLPELVLELTKKSEKVNLPSLYQRYLEGELKRQRLKKRIDLLIKPEKRFEIMEEIALELYLTNSSALSSNQIRKLSGKMPTGEQLWEMENLREIVTCSFLIRRGNDYSFSHQSFLEYLVARRLAKDIVNAQSENLNKRCISPTIFNFLCQMESNVQKGSIPTTADNTKVNFDINSLEILFQANKSKKWVSTNAISLLARLMPHELFRQLPFGQADLSDADLRMIDSTDALIGRDLVGANLTETYLVRAKLGVRANLANAKLERASLIGVDLTEAYLGGAFLKGVNLTKAYLGGAYLGEANLASANLRRANLAGAILEKAILAGAILERAILGEAQLREAYLANANLKGAYLVGADLREADLRGADLRGANLVGADLRGANLDVTNLKGISSY